MDSIVKNHTIENLENGVNNRKENNGGNYHPKGNRSAKTFLYTSPSGEEFTVFNESKKFCEEYNIDSKLFQKVGSGNVIKKPIQVKKTTKSSRINSVGWKRIELTTNFIR